MNFLDAAFHILQQAGEPLHYKEITQLALDQELVVTEGLTPDATMGSRLYEDTKKEGSRFRRAGKGYFFLAEPEAADGIRRQVMALNEQTREQLRNYLHSTPADRFEALIGELLIAIGFDEGTVEVTSYHGDGGIDVRGILNAGGITRVNAAVQVKRWKANISAPTVRDVRGSLTTQEQGIIITTSDFSRGAKIEANAIGKTPISLVNGDELLALLIEHGIGVEREQHTVLSLDEEFWGELTEPTEPAASSPPAIADSPQEKMESPPATRSAPIKAKVKFPLLVRAMNSDKTALLLNAEGHVSFDGHEYTSVSTAGAEASGWKACNGWKFWQYQDARTKEWRPIDALRQAE